MILDHQKTSDNSEYPRGLEWKKDIFWSNCQIFGRRALRVHFGLLYLNRLRHNNFSTSHKLRYNEKILRTFRGKIHIPPLSALSTSPPFLSNVAAESQTFVENASSITGRYLQVYHEGRIIGLRDIGDVKPSKIVSLLVLQFKLSTSMSGWED